MRGLDGFIVPRADRFQNEYVPPSDERLAWLTGFSGSAGVGDRAGRPRRAVRRRPLQVQVRERSGRRDVHRSSIWSRIRRRAGSRPICRAGAKLGYSPWLHTIDGAERLAKACAAKPALRLSRSTTIRSMRIWTDRPAAAARPVVLHDLRYAGEEAAEQARARARASS